MRRRWWKIALGVVAALLLAVGGAWLYLTSDAGSERVRKTLLSAFADALQGRLDVKHLSLKGGLIIIEGATLYTPEGELVASLERLEAEVALTPLLGKDVIIERAKVDGLRVDLELDERGLNLTRALTARAPSKPDDSQPGPAFHVDVQKLDLKGSHFSWQREYVLDGITLAGEAKVAGPILKLDGKLAATATLAGDPALPLALGVAGDEQKLGVTLDLGDAQLVGSFGIESLAGHVERLNVPPQVAQRFVKEFPLQVPLAAKGDASPEGLDVTLEAGAARVGAKAAFDRSGVKQFHLSAKDLDLHELLGRGRPSKIQLDANGRLSDPSLDTLDGELVVDGLWEGVGDIDVNATAKHGEIDLHKLQVYLPGAKLKAKGRGSRRELALRGDLDAWDLAQLSRAWGEATGSAPPRFAGAGELDVTLDGALQHPRLALKGKFPALRVDDVSLNDVSADARFIDLTRPFEAQLIAEARRIVAGERSFDDVRARVDTRGRDLDLELSTKGLADLKLAATGTVDADGQGLKVDDLVLHYPEADWKLEAPTHVSVAEGLQLDPLALKSGEMRVELRAVQKNQKVDAALDARNVDLTKLPKAFVPTKWGLGGRLDARATATGRQASPEVEAKVSLREGSVRTLRQLQLDAQVRYVRDRASGAVSGSSSLAAFEAAFDVPVKAVQQGKDEPLSAHVVADGVVLEALGPMLQVELPARGTASVTIDAKGTGAHPRVTAHIEAHDAAWTLGQPGSDRFIPVDKLVLDVAPADDGALGATLHTRAFGADAEVKLTTPLTLEGLRRKQPDLAALRALPIEVIADVAHLRLSQLASANLVHDSTLDGTVSLRATAKGSVDHPDVIGNVVLSEVKQGRFRPFSGEVSVESARDDTKVHVTLTRPNLQNAAFRIHARALAPLEVLADISRLERIGFKANGVVGPLTLEDVMMPNPDETQPKGSINAQIEASGTVVDPEVRVRGDLQQVAFGKVPLGKANLALDYKDAVSKLAVTLFTGSSGSLRASGTVQLDLSQPAVMKGVDWRSAPLEVAVESKGLDLGFLSGTVEQLPLVAGTLDANARVTGKLALPTLVGNLSLARGRFAVLGYGDYRDVEVKLDGTEQAARLLRLYARNSGGWVEASGSAMKHGEAWSATVTAASENFPIITDDQLRASATLKLYLEGTVTEDRIDVPKLVVPRAVIELPEVKAKDLQALERPDSIVLVRDGVPVNAREGKKLKKPGAEALAAAQAERERKARVISLTISAPRDVWVRSSDVNVEIGLSDGFRVEVDHGVTLRGDVFVRRGRVDVIGRRFDADPSSTVRFQGSPTRPYLNVIAEHKNEREGVTVFATIAGQYPFQVDRALKLSSKPPLSESEIFTLIATGRRALKQGSGSATINAEQAASIVGSFAAAQLKTVLAKRLPIDVLSIEAGTDGLKGTRIEGGKYINDSVYLGGQVRYGADRTKGENAAQLRIEYQFLPHWTLEAWGGDAAAFGADIMWGQEY